MSGHRIIRIFVQAMMLMLLAGLVYALAYIVNHPAVVSPTCATVWSIDRRLGINPTFATEEEARRAAPNAYIHPSQRCTPP